MSAALPETSEAGPRWSILVTVSVPLAVLSSDFTVETGSQIRLEPVKRHVVPSGGFDDPVPGLIESKTIHQGGFTLPGALNTLPGALNQQHRIVPTQDLRESRPGRIREGECRGPGSSLPRQPAPSTLD